MKHCRQIRWKSCWSGPLRDSKLFSSFFQHINLKSCRLHPSGVCKVYFNKILGSCIFFNCIDLKNCRCHHLNLGNFWWQNKYWGCEVVPKNTYATFCSAKFQTSAALPKKLSQESFLGNAFSLMFWKSIGIMHIVYESFQWKNRQRWSSPSPENLFFQVYLKIGMHYSQCLRKFVWQI
jgi:hypothetical protein